MNTFFFLKKYESTLFTKFVLYESRLHAINDRKNLLLHAVNYNMQSRFALDNVDNGKYEFIFMVRIVIVYICNV